MRHKVILLAIFKHIDIIGGAAPRVDISTEMNYSVGDLSIYPKEKVFK
jgi:hypothetical protein